ncbi:signal peptidase II [Candidatus Woesearchaeota archaeon]|jgi:lipoprotein signal peptidase|nr:signal peptidase II [Candidatus Woesearchaeota archaeon]
MTKKKSSGSFLHIALVVLVLDRLTKYIFAEHSIQNTGTLFGMGSNNLVWLGVSVAILAGIWRYRKSMMKNKWCERMLALVVGGAAGNILDRILYGGVIDFINLHFWPVFNIADAAITVGVIGLIWDEFRKKH